MSNELAYIFLGIGLGCLVFGILCTFLFIKFKKSKKEERDSFKLVTGNNKVFRFWQYYAIIFLMFVSFLAALILTPIAIEALI